MLQITIPATEYFDEKRGEFVYTKATTLQLEHSLVSLSKWESKWNKPFMNRTQKTVEECIDYIRCMTLTQNVNPLVYNGITQEIFDKVNAYIEAPMTATWFNEKNSKAKKNREVITAEIVYYWMVALNIPFECQKWHLNRLLTLIRVCNEKNSPQKKMSQKELAKHNRTLNEARLKRWKTKG